MIPTRQDLTVAELAKRWRCSTRTIRRKLVAGEFDGVFTVGQRHELIPVASVLEYEEKHTKAARGKRRAA